MMRAIVFLILMAFLPTLALGQTQKAPALTLHDLRGRAVSLSSYKGKVVLLNFWATWCPPCQAEVPDLIKWQGEYRGQGLQVIEARRFVRRFKINYPVWLGSQETKALFAEGETLPMTVVIDREGNIRDRIEGILLTEEFDEKIKPLLR